MRNNNDHDEKRVFRSLLTNLRALRAFEAVAYHQSFTNAAKELGVSQGAVSHQIKKLEERLGKPLFKRTQGGVQPLPEAGILNEVCCRSFNEIGEKLSLIGQKRENQILRVRSGPFFAMKVIAPRIADFISQNPGMQIHLNNLDPYSASLGAEDVLIKYCVNPPPHTTSVELIKGNLIMIGGPEIIKEGEAIANLLNNPQIARLHYRNMEDWNLWIEEFGFQCTVAAKNLFFDDQHTVLEAVRSGQGISLAERSLIQEDIAEGRLCEISDLGLQPKSSYKFVYKSERAASNPGIEAFKKWLQGEIISMKKS